MVKPSSTAYTLHYNPSDAISFRSATEVSTKQGEAVLWALYDNIKAQTLLTRGATSDLLSIATAQAMTQRGPKAKLVEFAGVGHAPTFVVPDQIQVALGQHAELLQLILQPTAGGFDAAGHRAGHFAGLAVGNEGAINGRFAVMLGPERTG